MARRPTPKQTDEEKVYAYLNRQYGEEVAKAGVAAGVKPSHKGKEAEQFAYNYGINQAKEQAAKATSSRAPATPTTPEQKEVWGFMNDRYGKDAADAAIRSGVNASKDAREAKLFAKEFLGTSQKNVASYLERSYGSEVAQAAMEAGIRESKGAREAKDFAKNFMDKRASEQVAKSGTPVAGRPDSFESEEAESRWNYLDKRYGSDVANAALASGVGESPNAREMKKFASVYKKTRYTAMEQEEVRKLATNRYGADVADAAIRFGIETSNNALAVKNFAQSYMNNPGDWSDQATQGRRIWGWQDAETGQISGDPGRGFGDKSKPLFDPPPGVASMHLDDGTRVTLYTEDALAGNKFSQVSKGEVALIPVGTEGTGGRIYEVGRTTVDGKEYRIVTRGDRRDKFGEYLTQYSSAIGTGVGAVVGAVLTWKALGQGWAAGAKVGGIVGGAGAGVIQEVRGRDVDWSDIAVKTGISVVTQGVASKIQAAASLSAVQKGVATGVAVGAIKTGEGMAVDNLSFEKAAQSGAVSGVVAGSNAYLDAVRAEAKFASENLQRVSALAQTNDSVAFNASYIATLDESIALTDESIAEYSGRLTAAQAALKAMPFGGSDKFYQATGAVNGAAQAAIRGGDLQDIALAGTVGWATGDPNKPFQNIAVQGMYGAYLSSEAKQEARANAQSESAGGPPEEVLPAVDSGGQPAFSTREEAAAYQAQVGGVLLQTSDGRWVVAPEPATSSGEPAPTGGGSSIIRPAYTDYA